MLRIIQELQEFGPIWNIILKQKNEARDILTEETRVHSQEIQGRILMSGIRMKKAPEARLKGVSG
jgi:hypothetical protein